MSSNQVKKIKQQNHLARVAMQNGNLLLESHVKNAIHLTYVVLKKNILFYLELTKNVWKVRLV